MGRSFLKNISARPANVILKRDSVKDRPKIHKPHRQLSLAQKNPNAPETNKHKITKGIGNGSRSPARGKMKPEIIAKMYG